MLNISVPQLAAQAAAMPADGVGLMRAEFLALHAGRHPRRILAEGGADAYVQLFRDGIQAVAAAFHPRPVTYRTSDLKSNEYRGLAGGEEFEPQEANPMIGARGVYRYITHPDEFALELAALRQVRAEGFDNVRVMLPFVRTLGELTEVKALIASSGLLDDGIELWAMAEVPSIALLAQDVAAECDGLSIGSNDLVALVLGVDRDSPDLNARYRSNDPAVLEALRRIIEGAHAEQRPVSICGDHPSSERELVQALLQMGIDCISVVPQAFAQTSALLDELTLKGARS
jgi:pyruvate,water dikinase